MKHFLKKIFAYLLIFICFLLVYGVVCDLLYKNKNMFLGNTKRYWQLSIKNTDYDYAVIGSSRAYGSIDVNLLDSLTDQNGINLGLDGSGFNENYVSVKLFLLNKNKLDKIYLQIDPYSFMSKESFSNSFYAYAYLPYWDSDETIKDVLHEEIPLIKDSPFYIPYLGYFIYNNYYSPFQIINSFLKYDTFCENSEFNCINGNKLEKQSISNQPIITNAGILNFTMNKRDNYYYNQILELAAENNIQIITFTAPTLENLDNDFENFLQNIKSDIYFKSGMDWMSQEKYFINHTHINFEGRKVFTTEFANFLLR
ncbi:hypothetical protein BC962_2381 [Gillisia mitskevichiae]|uniref:Uncharacterized protein n=1 Tax=Gillisia mitskevichiae TaxID=270921 RepID=A0A495PPK8_9FLAO|nr:hypothetical protein [Gillisia mitskevichiae]RKS50609.1 hypothetical protein BC962_2381 [Gillisia mitskevichiae]